MKLHLHHGRFNAAGLCLVFSLACTIQLLAVDPLPPTLQKASPAAQRAYLEQKAQESLRDKLAVGQRRYVQRNQYKQGLVRMLRHEANARNQILHANAMSSMDGAEPKMTMDQVNLSYTDWLLGSGLLLGLGILLRLHFIGAPKLSPKRA